jgi:hypothetical protein
MGGGPSGNTSFIVGFTNTRTRHVDEDEEEGNEGSMTRRSKFQPSVANPAGPSLNSQLATRVGGAAALSFSPFSSFPLLLLAVKTSTTPLGSSTRTVNHDGSDAIDGNDDDDDDDGLF